MEDLHDDGFEGSYHEHRIFSEVFFGKDIGGTSKGSLVSRVIKFKYEDNKVTDVSLCSNSDNSAVTSQSSPRSLMVEESGINENSGGASGSGCFLEAVALVESNDQNKCVKRMKFSAKPSKTELGASKIVAATILDGTPAADVDLPSQTVTLHLVESSCQAITSRCYLLKQVKVDRGHDVHDPEVLKCRSPNSNRHFGHEMFVGKASASPVSKESLTTQIFLASPSSDVLGKFASPLLAEESEKELVSPGPYTTNMLKADSKKDPRPLLQGYVFCVLLAMGWCIEKRKRPSRKYMESIYRSPDGRVFRDFPKVWRWCGQILFADGYDLLLQDSCKEWADISEFWSDLLDVLMNIEKVKNKLDHSNELAYQWSLLDPFVKVVFIDRKVGSLRKGCLVKATRSLLIDSNEKCDGIVALREDNGLGNHSGQTNLLAWHCDPSLASKSPSTICEGSYHACDGQSGDKDFSRYDGQTNFLGQYPMDVSIDMIDRECLRLGGSVNGMRDETCRMCKDKIRSLDRTSLLACGSDSTYIQLCSCQHDVPVSAGNANVQGVSESVSPHQGSNLVDLDDGNGHLEFNLDEPMSTQFVASGVLKYHGLVEAEGEQLTQASNCKMKDKADVILKKKMRRKSKKISEIRSTIFHQNDIKVEEDLFVNIRTKKSGKKSSPHSNTSKSKKMHWSGDGSENCKKRPHGFQIKDDDLLVSAIIKNKDFSRGARRSVSKKKACKLKAPTMSKCQKGSCRLLPRNLMGSRSVLSWLITAGVICLNDIIQCRNPKDNVVIKDGLVTRDGIICNCCNVLFSTSKFENHAGFNLSHPCLSLFMESGKPFTLCQLEAWSAEYKSKKSGNPVVRADENDQNDDSCGRCGDGGELICCDNCPSTFHQACLCTEELPEGSWYCPNCTCQVCGDLVYDKDASSSYDAYKCSQCEHKFHGACQKGANTCTGVTSDTWFCSGSCQEIFSGLQSLIGMNNHIHDGFCWMILRCIHEDQKVHSAQRFALKAECNSKLAVALTIMEECFQSMLDPRTGVEMIPHVLYNWGSEFARLNFHGFYTMVLEKDDIVISVASIRVHGVKVAEMPLIATCSKYRRQGMCRRLMTAIEEMLISFKVEKLVITAIPDLVDTWTEGFGFTHVSNCEKQSLNKINLMVFPGSVYLKKPMYQRKEEDTPSELGNTEPLTETGNCPIEENAKSMQQSQGDCADEVHLRRVVKLVELKTLGDSEVSGERETIAGGVEIPGNASPMATGELTKVCTCFDGELGVEFIEPSKEKICSNEVAAEVKEKMAVEENRGSNLQEQFSKLSCSELVSSLRGSQTDLACNVLSVTLVASLDRRPQHVCELNEK